MSLLSGLKIAYKALRSILFAVILITAVLYIGLYVSLSIPTVQRSIKSKAEAAVSDFLKAKVEIDKLVIMPFSEVRMQGVTIYTPEGDKCICVNTLGAGINLWRLIYNRKVEITYAEVIGLDAKISKLTSDSPLNIQFIIDAVSPKDKNKPPTPFDIKLHSVVIRNSSLSYDLLSAPHSTDSNIFDPNHIALQELRADVALPQLKNDDFTIDLRRLSFKEKSGFTVEKLTAFTHITATSLDLSKFSIRLPSSKIMVSDISLKFKSLKDIVKSLETGNHNISVEAPDLAPRDFASFFAPLANIGDAFTLNIEADGNLNALDIEKISLSDKHNGFMLNLKGVVKGLPAIDNIQGSVDSFELSAADDIIKWASSLLAQKNESLSNKFSALNNIDLRLKGDYSASARRSKFKSELSSNLGRVYADGNLKWSDRNNVHVDGEIEVSEIELGKILDKNNIGALSMTASADLNILNKDVEGFCEAFVSELVFNNIALNDISLHAQKEGKELEVSMETEDEILSSQLTGSMYLDGDDSQWNINGVIDNFIPSRLNILPKYKNYNLSGTISAGLTGNDVDNLTGTVSLKKLSFGKLGNKSLTLRSIDVSAIENDSVKEYKIDSDILKGSLKGNFTFNGLMDLGKSLLSDVSPTYLPYSIKDKNVIIRKKSVSNIIAPDNARLTLRIMPDADIADFFDLNIRPYTDVIINGYADKAEGVFSLDVSAPYILKGKDKLIRNSSVALRLKKEKGLETRIMSTVPAKNDDADIKIDIAGFNDKADASIGWTFEKNKTAKGNISLEGNISKDALTGKPDISLNILPSDFELNGSKWNIDRSALSYANNVVNVNDLRIWHAGQFVNINGKASDSPLDAVIVKLAGIDLSYIFEALNINYVNFGGIATGEILASNLFTKMPVLRTERLYVKDLSYNDAVIGDGRVESHWINDFKKIAINADVREGNHRVALVGGGVFLGKDSLSFDFLADHVNVGFLKPFMSAFTSDVGGRASGRVKLFGTFKDIDLVGKVHADSICMKVDYTNVYYHGSDSVYIRPGVIEIPEFKLYDKYGNSALLTGTVRHKYFHDPEFEFRMSNAQNLLAFDTNPHINPDWYGKIFASGGGSLKGVPGYISMLMDVTTAPNSDFTFVLSETQTASDYTFLTFTDKKKEELEALEGKISVEEQLYKSLPPPVVDVPSIFAMDIRCTVTPSAALTLVMDPKAGDKITARGGGPLQISYDTESDEMKIYGKYTLAEGNYNFSLQDLILRDFKIYGGSSISFNGDPMQGVLDITAAYRVNTNLSDLDKSFSTDRDLNRTNVPVDALLKVTGDMRSPEIGFDIALPTLTQDVERKVKSIISTEDMMSRQIIYLLALNRFYTPEYMGTTSNGGELASVASSTLSSQLSNFVGQLTDKVTLAPSFRSDKGDFSDMEVDLALSSRLLDNRLLINGNFGYRDRTTSQSTFIGDFDIEYLLNRSGGLRLKAYNHFNDQNYYLRSALTTQGIGVIYRKDFDNPFTFLKRRKSKKDNKQDGTAK